MSTSTYWDKVRMESKELNFLFFLVTVLVKKSSTNKQKKKPHTKLNFLPAVTLHRSSCRATFLLSRNGRGQELTDSLPRTHIGV